MRKLILIIGLFAFTSCSNDTNCEELVDDVYREYHILIQEERLGGNNPSIIKILEEQRDRKAILVCQ